jgi:hypothetical protein
MAKRKTRKQKIKQAQKKGQIGALGATVKKTRQALDLGYEPKLIRKDMQKTIWVCGLILSLELLIWIWLGR